ncbi:MAG: lycopene beta-cyclase CrtY [Deltaproteobacteria bacterium]|jgi:lycopene beta-cyclase|nr:lycopene beta-cyclase CrtY [Deltaproteobacteria bacterium]
MEIFDYILVGGGLQNGLIALALLDARPDVRIAMIERGDKLGGNHTWCFHDDDVPPTARAFVDPLIRYRWPGYSVAFPNLSRSVERPYYGATSDELHQAVATRLEAAPGCQLFLGRTATEVKGQLVTLDDGKSLPGQVVIDSRGPDKNVAHTGYQKFVGLEVELESPHHLDQPWLMDATVPQTDGFRFFYVLPLSPTRLLLEDTYFADGVELDMPALRAGIEAYANSRGYRFKTVIREEHGVLPLPWDGGVEAPSASPLIAGYRGGWFHPATGYSFPVAVRLAEFVANTPVAQLFGPRLQALAAEQRKQVRYCHKLNRMLFRWFYPDQRWNVFERFYKLPEPLIRRFYALTMTTTDRARLLVGRPPRGLSIRAGLARRSLNA